MSVIVIAFTSLDGIAEDPDGSDGTGRGGWMFRYGPDAVAGDKFRLGKVLDDGVLLLGSRTWRLFAQLWPNRAGTEFPDRMNAAAKLVASRTPLAPAELAAWSNSRALEGDLLEAVKREQRDVVVAGSLGLVHRLAAADLVDEYRLLVYPVLLGRGRPLFPADGPAVELDCVQAEQEGPLVRSRFLRSAR